MPTVHASAIVDPAAELGVDVDVGPYAVIRAGVVVGDRTRLMPYVHIEAGCRIGPDCQVFTGAALGHSAQKRGLVARPGELEIGARCIIREHVTVHAAAEPDGRTTVGDDVYLMAGSHVAHDCSIGHGVTIANGALIAGHATIGAHSFVSGNVVVHQFVQVGTLAMIGGQARVAKDVPPFMVVAGNSRVRGVNLVGLRRHGLSASARRTVVTAHRILYRSGLNVSQATDRLRRLDPTPELERILDFIERSSRGLCGGGPARRFIGWPPGAE